jgi:hypothetical protein
MDKRFSWIFLLASGAFFIFIVGLTGYRIENARRHNTVAVRERLTELADQALSVRDSTGGYDAPQFSKDMKAVFDAEPRLLLLSIHSAEDGILYLVARNRSYLKEPTAIRPEWRGIPAYRVSRGYETLLSTTVQDGITEPTVDGLFVIMGREDLLPVVRDDLFLFLAFLLVCGVLILIVMSVQQDSAYAQASFPGTPSPPRQEYKPPEHPGVPRSTEKSEGSRPAAPAAPARALTSPRTGLVWSEHLEPRLRAELERAASADQDLSLARLRIDEPFVDAKLPVVHAGIAQLLKESFPLHDLIFETGNDSCTILLPDIGIDAAVAILEEFRRKAAGAPVEGKVRSISVGVSSRGGRLLEQKTLLEEADVALAKASREGGNQVIGFRADAARFRDRLAGAPA